MKTDPADTRLLMDIRLLMEARWLITHAGWAYEGTATEYEEWDQRERAWQEEVAILYGDGSDPPGGIIQAGGLDSDPMKDIP